MLYNMNSILEYLISSGNIWNIKGVFVDLADPKKRTTQEIQQVLELLKLLQKKFPVYLGLNLSEAQQCAYSLNLPSEISDDPNMLEAISREIQRNLGLEGVIIHGIRYASFATGNIQDSVNGPYCVTPLITTGAGDHFNGGLLFGLSIGLLPWQALVVGVVSSGYYVRNSKSATLESLRGFMQSWGQGSFQ